MPRRPDPLIRATCRAALCSLAILIATAARAQPAPDAVQLTATYTVDAWADLGGGARPGAILLHSGLAGAQMDLSEALGWRGAALGASAVFNDAASVSRDLVGDLHGIDNRDAADAALLFEAWVRQSFRGGYAKAGRIDLNSEFGVDRTAAAFINGAHGLGLEMAQLGWNGPSVYPHSQLAALAAFERGAVWKAGIFSGSRTAADVPASGGVPLLGIVEVSRETRSGRRLTLGGWRHSAGYGSTLRGEAGRRATSGGYAILEQPLGQLQGRRVAGFLRFGAADPKSHVVAADLGAGVVVSAPFLGRDGEALGLAVLASRTGAHARRAPGDGPPLAKGETVIEATWRAPLGRGLVAQPDLQYVVRPGGVAGRRDALVLGLRLEANWSAGL